MLLNRRRILEGGVALLALGWLVLPPLAQTAEPGPNNRAPNDAIETLQIDPARVLHAVPAIRGVHWQFKEGRSEPREGISPHKGETGCYGSLVDMKKEHLALAAQMGVTTIRCGIEHGSLEDRDQPGKYSEEGFARIERFFGWCGEYHIHCIFDLHAVFGMEDGSKRFWDSEELQQRWCAVWQEIARRFKANPQVLAYEPCNEPSPPYASRYRRWNPLAKRVTAAIRQVDPSKPIIIDCLNGCHPGGFEGLEPTGDTNAWYSFHFYEPHAFHCQKRLWLADQGTYHYPGEFRGKWWNRQMLVDQWQAALDFADRHHVPLFAGEFGCVHEVPEMEDAVWLLDMVSLLDAHNVGWTYYHFMSHAIDPHWQEHFDCGLYIYDVPHQRLHSFDRKVSLLADLMKLRGSVLDVPQPADQWLTVYAVAEPTGKTRVYLANKSRDQAKTVRLQLVGGKGAGRAKYQQMKRGGRGFRAAGDLPLADGMLKVTMEPLTIHRIEL
jgi:hypothetical protein